MNAWALGIAIAAVLPPEAVYREGLDLLYDGSTDRALARFAEISAGSPEDPWSAYFEALALCWKIEQRPESTALDKEFHRKVDRILAIADTRLRQDPLDFRARLSRGAAHGVRSRLHLFRRERREAARAAVKMREDFLLARKLEPASSEVRFGLGLYDYYADVLPRLTKFLRFLSGMPGGDRERGLALIRETRESDALHATEAQIQLYEIYAFYEKVPDRAYEEIRSLRERYPGSPLWALKLAEHQRDRLGLYAEGAAVTREVLTASGRGEVNYAPVAAAFARLSLGSSLLLDLRLSEARRVLLPLREGVPEAPGIEAEAHLLLGRSLELEGDREAAVAHYDIAARTGDRTARKLAEEARSSPIPPRQVQATHLIGEARRLREAGREAEAAERYSEALRLWPRSQEAALRVAEDALTRGHVATARNTLERLASEEDPKPPWVRPWSQLLLARAHDVVGERSAAIDLYKQVYKEPLGRRELQAQAEAGLRQPFSPSGAAGRAP